MNKKMFVGLRDAKKYAIPGGTCYLYPDSPTGRLSAAYVEQDGRYPETGYRQNKVCTEAMFIIEGSFTFFMKNKKVKAKKNDIVYVPPMTPYAVTGKGKTLVFIEPKWDSAQNVPTTL